MAALPKDHQPHAERSLEHFLDLYRSLDPVEIAARCKVPFDGNAFSLRIMGEPRRAGFPGFDLLDQRNREPQNPYEKILFLRYLCEGRYAEPLGKQLSYREIPWGDLYFPNFESRCVKRLARSFGDKLEGFRNVMEETGGLRAQRLGKGDAGYRFDFFNGLYMSFLVWAGDDEFPPSAQILFDDNFPPAFTAEDLAVAADIAIDWLKRRASP